MRAHPFSGTATFTVYPHALALAVALFVAGCGGGSSSTPADPVIAVPTGIGAVDTAPVQDQTAVLPFVDYAYTNQRGYAQYATVATNAGVRVVAGFLDLWTPSTLLVDAGQTAPAVGTFPAITASTWSGIPGSASDGKIVNAGVLAANIAFAATETGSRTADQATAAYLDDRRNKGYSVTDG